MEVGEIRGKGEGELDHHVVGAVGEGVGKDEVGGDGDEDTQEEKVGPGDYYVLSVRLVDAHPPEAESKTLELVHDRLQDSCAAALDG
ncbi:hypothetical protein MUK42_16204 [Musa troglodytarum]|uniref:Uncharacterized protein n=1 Tax=Musa troglodytarum TaxID=320322 RepID=A0A9E7H3N8_9LILI|nr:hypothetical protein MUK42_16204 [Musa troglodytarum]